MRHGDESQRRVIEHIREHVVEHRCGLVACSGDAERVPQAEIRDSYRDNAPEQISSVSAVFRTRAVGYNTHDGVGYGVPDMSHGDNHTRLIDAELFDLGQKRQKIERDDVSAAAEKYARGIVAHHRAYLLKE